MLSPHSFFEALQHAGFSFFAGVPDSLLKEFCAYVDDNVPAENHVITANEGAAVALAAGYHLATGKAGLVYMQNSGTGNAINPLLSLADPAVYAIPMMLVIGWRGRPGVADEPQHVKQGEQQEALIQALGYPYEILSRDPIVGAHQVSALARVMEQKSSPVVLLVKEKTFEQQNTTKTVDVRYELSREEALKTIVSHLTPAERIVATTGKTSRELFEIREATGHGHENDFLTVGSMGHAVVIAMGIAAFSTRLIWCVDGDGAALMHLGSMATVGQRAPGNFVHLLINNGAHESVGGQSTGGYRVPFHLIATNLGYQNCFSIDSVSDLESIIESIREMKGPSFVEVRVSPGARRDLGRPTRTPRENKTAFMENM